MNSNNQEFDRVLPLFGLSPIEIEVMQIIIEELWIDELIITKALK